MQIDGINKKIKMGFSSGISIEQNLKLLFGKLVLEHVPVSQKEATLVSGNGQLTVNTMYQTIISLNEV